MRHLKIFADLLGEIVVDFVVARDAGGFPSGAVHVNRVVATLTQQLAAMFFEMSNQVSALQALIAGPFLAPAAIIRPSGDEYARRKKEINF